MIDKKEESKKKEKYEKLKIIGNKQAVIYWILAVLCVVGVILYMRWFNDYAGKNIAEREAAQSSSSSAQVIYQICI